MLVVISAIVGDSAIFLFVQLNGLSKLLPKALGVGRACNDLGMNLPPFIFGVALPKEEHKLEGITTDFEIIRIAPFKLMRALQTLVCILSCHLSIRLFSNPRALRAGIAKD